MKNERQALIMELVEENDVGTQEELLELLAERGITCTQATISRDIKHLHLLKVPAPNGGYRYSAASQRMKLNFADKLQTIFRECVLSAESAQNMAILKTIGGMANAAAFALDNMEGTDIVGTLAGDDTVLLVFHDSLHASDFCEQVREMLH